jgi:MrfA Zn-binding domain
MKQVVPTKTSLDEEWEGIFLVGQDDSSSEFTQGNSEIDMRKYGNIHSYSMRTKPSSLPDEQHRDWLESKSLRMVRHVAGLNMIQSILGVIEGSTRNKIPLFNVILSGSKNQQKPTIFVRTFITEGIVFQLDYVKILYWFEANKELISPEEPLKWDKAKNPRTEYQNIIRDNLLYKDAAYKLLHTYSHMLIQQSTIHTGLDIQSLSEKIYPNVASIFLYSTNNINIGGLESTFDSDLMNWFERMYELASDCPQDPSCMIDEGGACNACSYVPEFVCQNFNQDLDRSTLVGNSTRFSRGFFDDYKSSS